MFVCVGFIVVAFRMHVAKTCVLAYVCVVSRLCLYFLCMIHNVLLLFRVVPVVCMRIVCACSIVLRLSVFPLCAGVLLLRVHVSYVYFV